MAEVTLTNEQFRTLVNLTATRAGVLTPQDRQNLLDLAGLRDFAPRLDFATSAQAFSTQLIRTLQDHGTLRQTGQPALVSLLKELHTIVEGQEDEAAFIATLLAPYADQARADGGGKGLKVFVSYRRKSWAFTHRMAGDLKQHLDADIFVDVTGVDQADFERAILSHLREADIVLLVVSEETFSPRIQQAGDWVRKEIALALQLRKPIVLIAVVGLFPPEASTLPQDIRGVTRMQGIRFYPDFWDEAVTKLAKFVPKAAASPIVVDDEAETATAPAPQTGPKADPVPPTSGRPSPQTQFAEATRHIEDGQFEEALALLRTLQQQGYKPRFGKLEDVIERAEQGIAEQEAEVQRLRRLTEAADAYAELSHYIRAAAPRQALAELERFLSEYPEHGDPEHLRGKVKLPEPPKSKISADQQRLLDIMLDPQRAPVERAQAGDELAALGDPRPGVGLRPDGLPDIVWCEVPAGEFTMGSQEDTQFSLLNLNNPTKKISLPTFYIAKYPITYSQYRAFLDAEDGFRNAQWWSGLHADGLKQQKAGPGEQKWKIANRPAENVSWYDAVAFGRWLSAKLGYAITLSTEEQWEKAARGTDARVYPYGNDYDSKKCNTLKTGLVQTSAVGIFLEGASPYGALDMSGNVDDWTLNEYDTRSSADLSNTARRVVRGGSWNNDRNDARAAYRVRDAPGGRSYLVGFRVSCSAPVGSL